jgi:predicted transcriptional regulator/transcriptional regulator with XRE-family HTH domain
MPTEQELIELAKTCHSKTDIAKILGLSVSGVCRYINKLGISDKLIFAPKEKTSNISSEQLEDALDKCDWHQTETAKYLNSSVSTVCRLIGFYNLVRVDKKDIKLDIEFKIFDVPVVNKLGFSDLYLRDVIKRIENSIEVVDNKTWLCDYFGDNGYPTFVTRLNNKSTSHKIHRIIYFLTKRVLPTEICLCHIDDNRLNVHPDNLFEGTTQDNNIDKAKKFRTGSDLKEADIHHIVELYEVYNWTQKDIGEKFGLSQAQIGRILRGEYFKHVERKVFRSISPTRKKLGEDIKTSKVTNEQVLEMRKLFGEGVSKGELSRRYDLDRKTISDIINYKTWKHID